MFTGALVLNMFGACWCFAGLLSMGAPVWLLGMPMLVAAMLIAVAWRASRYVAPRTPAEEARVGKLIGVWSAAEGVGFFVAVNVLRNLHRESEIAPVLAAIVGLHFIPLARGMPLPVYYFTGGALLVIASATWFLPPALGTPAACLASAVVLWATSAALSARALVPREASL